MDEERRTLRLGIVSLCVLAGGSLLAVAIMARGFVLLSRTRMGGSGEDVILAGAGIGVLFDMIALALGVAGVRQKGRAKGAALLGTALSGAILLGVLTVVILFIGPALRWYG